MTRLAAQSPAAAEARTRNDRGYALIPSGRANEAAAGQKRLDETRAAAAP